MSVVSIGVWLVCVWYVGVWLIGLLVSKYGQYGSGQGAA